MNDNKNINSSWIIHAIGTEKTTYLNLSGGEMLQKNKCIWEWKVGEGNPYFSGI